LDAARIQAGRRLDLALALIDEQDGLAAAELAREACALAPGFAEAHFVLGQALELLGAAEASEAYRAYLEREPQDRLGANLRLTLMGERAAPERLPAAYVKELFDQAAATFEQKMRDKLGYRGPELLWSLLAGHRHCLPAQPALLDLGCGTGAAGEVFAQLGGRMDGLDLSPKMIAKARGKGLYGDLWAADLLEETGAAAKQYDLLLAADVFNYIGDLSPALAACWRRMKPGALLLFTLEAQPQDAARAPFDLGPGQRYRHDPAVVRAWLASSLLEILSVESAVLRQEKRQPVECWLFLARRPTAECLGDPREPGSWLSALPSGGRGGAQR
jgi:predicted TPR repeat methyltransferase